MKVGVFCLVFFWFIGVEIVTAQEDTLRVINLQEVGVHSYRRVGLLRGGKEGSIEWDMKQMQMLPQILSNADPLRYVRLLPGVQTSDEMSSGIYIQGCESFHNQISLNGVTVYSPLHLFGFFSVFNSGHISHFSVQKSRQSVAVGEKLGGRIDMFTHDSVATVLRGELNIGLISSQGSLCVPLSGKSCLYLSARSAYLNLLYKKLLTVDGNEVKYTFGDYNVTLVHDFDSLNKLRMNFYYGEDYMTMDFGQYQTKGRMKWGNLVGSVDMTSRFGRSEMVQQLFVTGYRQDTKIAMGDIYMDLYGRIYDWGYKGKWMYPFGNGNTLTTGVDYVNHALCPQYPEVEGGYTLTTERDTIRHYNEIGGYVSHAFLSESGIGMEYGVRLDYISGEGVEEIDVHPRLTLTYCLTEKRKLMFHYGRSHQYINQVSLSGQGFPVNFMTSVTKGFPAQEVQNFTLGYVDCFRRGTYDVSLDIYYKRLYQQTEFSGSLLDMINQKFDLADHVLTGNGENYGMEFMFRRNQGRFTGWVAYTLGWAKRRYNIGRESKSYPSDHDRRHDLNVLVSYKLNRKIDVGAVFVYASGSPYTAVTNIYMLGGNFLYEYESRNHSRMPAYHRLDLSLNYSLKKDKHREQGFNVSLYNAYAHKNPFFVNASVGKSKLKLRSVAYYTIVPSVSYFFKF